MIVINGRFLSQRLTGIQRFAYEICCAMQQIGADMTILAPENIAQDYEIDRLPVTVIGGKGSHYWEQVTLPRYMKRHHDGQWLVSLSGLSPIGYRRTILTIHDVSYLLRPRAYSRLYCLYYRLMTPWAARRAAKILTVSRFSQSEISRSLGIPSEKITVVYNAVRLQALQTREPGKPYLLAVGSLMPRKNIERLLEAYSSIDSPDFELYIVGSIQSGFAKSGLDRYRKVPGIRFLGYVQTDELTRMYRNATAYINPSLYEGFGIPLIEAMTQECPVVVSDIPVFHEVCGDAALYFDPMHVSDIQSRMQTIMHDPALRTQLTANAKEQVKRFSWEQSARTITDLINEL